MNGMQAKAKRRHHAQQWTQEGLPRDANAWTVKDWSDLWRHLRAATKAIAARHRAERKWV